MAQNQAAAKAAAPAPAAPARKRWADMSPVERKQAQAERQERKVENAKRPDTTLVNTKTLDAVYFTQFINSLDHTMDRMRRSIGTRGSRVTLQDFENVTASLNALTGLINIFCADISKLVNVPYRAPRGHLDLRKNNSLPKAVEELDNTIDLLMTKRDAYAALIEDLKSKAAAADAAKAAKKEEAPAAAAAPKKSSTKAKAETAAAASA